MNGCKRRGGKKPGPGADKFEAGNESDFYAEYHLLSARESAIIERKIG